MSLASVLSSILVILGLAAFLLGWMGTRSIIAGLPMMLDLWTGAGLIRLSGLTWNALLVVAILILVRKVTMAAIREG